MCCSARPARRLANNLDCMRNPVSRPGVPRQQGFSLIELLIVISLISILAGLALTRLEPSIHDQLQAAAQVVASDLAYARSLAVANNSSYRITFDTDADRYVLTHSGTNLALDRLPSSPYRRPDDPPDEQSTDLSRLPLVSGSVDLMAVVTSSDPPVTVFDLEYGPLGETTRADGTTLWISSGQGDVQRYISVAMDPITGLAWIGDVQAAAPDIPTP